MSSHIEPTRPDEASLPETLDFDAMYSGNSTLSSLFGDLTPWDIPEPQPFLVDLVETGQVTGNVLDAGCGLGNNAFFLADRGYQVTAFDASPACIDKAKDRARQRGVEPTFLVADATNLDGFDARFDTVIDSALYHCLEEADRPRYIDGLHRLAQPGARLHLVCFADLRPKRLRALNYISEAEIRATLAPGWRIDTIRLTGFVTAFTREHMERGAKAFHYDDVDEYISGSFDVDDRGRYLCQCWQVAAERV